MSFESLKSKTSLLDKLNAELSKEGKSGYIDDRLWKPQMGKDDVGSAVIRFLPISDEDAMPLAKVWSHAFKGPGGWYIENSLTTLGQTDPIAELNRSLWNSGLESDKEVARKQKRKLTYYSNIYVIEDSANPANEGKVFLYKYGKKIHDKILALVQPEFKGVESIDPFDLWNGADFHLRIKKVAGFWNYDSSVFGPPGKLGDFSTEKLREIFNQMHDLSEFTDPNGKHFKTYAELGARLNAVLSSNRPISKEVIDEEVAYMPSAVPAAMKEELSTLNSGFNDPDITSSSPFLRTDESNKNYDYFDQLANEEM